MKTIPIFVNLEHIFNCFFSFKGVHSKKNIPDYKL